MNGNCPPPGWECDDGNAVPWDGCTEGKLSEVQANTVTEGFQVQPDVAAIGANSFVVVWAGQNYDEDEYGVVARVYDDTGVPAGPEFLVGQTEEGSQTIPRVSACGAGFAVTWTSFHQDEDEPQVFFRIFAASGEPTTDEIPVMSIADDWTWFSDISCFGDGSIVVAWTTNSKKPGRKVGYRFFSPVGQALGEPSWEEQYSDAGNVNLAVCGNDSLMMLFRNNSPGQSLLAKRFYLDNSVDETMELVGDDDLGEVTSLGHWCSIDCSCYAIYSDGGNTEYLRLTKYEPDIGEIWTVDVATVIDSIVVSAVGGFGDDGVIVTWSGNSPPDEHDIFASVYDFSGQVVAPLKNFPVFTANDQMNPSISAHPTSGAIVVWQSDEQDGQDSGVYFRRLFDDLNLW